jgi:hypothetical protein
MPVDFLPTFLAADERGLGHVSVLTEPTTPSYQG